MERLVAVGNSITKLPRWFMVTASAASVINNSLAELKTKVVVEDGHNFESFS